MLWRKESTQGLENAGAGVWRVGGRVGEGARGCRVRATREEIGFLFK